MAEFSQRGIKKMNAEQPRDESLILAAGILVIRMKWEDT
jgi:hypothetical protein